LPEFAFQSKIITINVCELMAAKKSSRKPPKRKAAPIPYAIPLTPAEIEELRADRRAADAICAARWGKVKTTSDLLAEIAAAEKTQE
jgi:hypothetical protein